jgi:hypothetical protein
MIVNFRARGISRGARKLAGTPTLNLKKKSVVMTFGTAEQFFFLSLNFFNNLAT